MSTRASDPRDVFESVRREALGCRAWERELDLVRPRFIGLLGATAAQAVLGRDFRLTRHRGEWFDVGTAGATATVHPSAVLRAGDRRAEEYDGLVRDLSKIAAEL